VRTYIVSFLLLLEHQKGRTVAKDCLARRLGIRTANLVVKCGPLRWLAHVRRKLHKKGSGVTISGCGVGGVVDFESDAAISHKIDSIQHAAEN
jgi:hypothetical protein